jgi:hypothetical protein
MSCTSVRGCHRNHTEVTVCPEYREPFVNNTFWLKICDWDNQRLNEGKLYIVHASRQLAESDKELVAQSAENFGVPKETVLLRVFHVFEEFGKPCNY